eukprot:scaffold5025_cov145-Amphora_coffeaeformis.AAC.1
MAQTRTVDHVGRFYIGQTYGMLYTRMATLLRSAAPTANDCETEDRSDQLIYLSTEKGTAFAFVFGGPFVDIDLETNKSFLHVVSHHGFTRELLFSERNQKA